jgi:dihydroneopterin aldolase
VLSRSCPFAIMELNIGEANMASNMRQAHNYEAVIKAVRGWPAAQRLALVQEVLTTLAPDVALVSQRQPTLARALGLLATNTPAPSDIDIAALLDERRRERYSA